MHTGPYVCVSPRLQAFIKTAERIYTNIQENGLDITNEVSAMPRGLAARCPRGLTTRSHQAHGIKVGMSAPGSATPAKAGEGEKGSCC